MIPLFAYIIKSTISLTVLYLLFLTVMRRHNNHSLNRFLLLGIILFSVVVPFFNVQIVEESQPVKQLQLLRDWVETQTVSKTTIQEVAEPMAEVIAEKTVNYWLLGYTTIVGILFLQIVSGIFRIGQILAKAKKIKFQQVVVAVVKEKIQPFSFFNKIVLSERDFNENRNIVVTHERAHIELGHTFDLIVSELLSVMHFFNPLVWIMCRDLKLIHEYQADQAVLDQGIDAQKYQLLVVEKAVGKRRFAMASQFTQKPILKRLQMMKNSKVEKWAVVKLFLFVPLLALLLHAFARPELIRNVNKLIPTIQKDSTDIWLQQWTPENIQNLNGGLMMETEVIKPPRPGSKPNVTKNKYPTIFKRDVFSILINSKNRILLDDRLGEEKEVYSALRKFVAGESPFGRGNDAARKEEKHLPLAGKVMISRGVIALRHDLATDKTFIQRLVKEVGKIYLEARNNAATKIFSKKYFQLSVAQKTDIDHMVPIRFFIVEPKKTK